MTNTTNTTNTTKEKQETTEAPKSIWRRLGWLALIWAASVLALAAFAGLMRVFMHAIGLET